MNDEKGPSWAALAEGLAAGGKNEKEDIYEQKSL
jgi:hypothetical protein